MSTRHPDTARRCGYGLSSGQTRSGHTTGRRGSRRHSTRSKASHPSGCGHAPPLADMIYAAAAAYMGDFAAELEPTLRRLEDEAAKEAVR